MHAHEDFRYTEDSQASSDDALLHLNVLLLRGGNVEAVIVVFENHMVFFLENKKRK